MKTLELLNVDEKVAAYQMRTMDVKELERHAKKILAMLGQHDYDKVMAAVIKEVPRLQPGANRFQVLQAVVQQSLGGQETENNHSVLERLTVVIMVIIARKFTSILQSQA